MNRDIVATLKQCELFAHLDAKALASLAEQAQWLELRGGSYLYHAGEPGDALYLIANGRISVAAPNSAGELEVVAHLGRNEVVGEVALLTGQPRSVTTRAVRDSAFIRIGKAEFEQLLATHPQAMFRAVRQIVMRLQRLRVTRARDTIASTRSLAVLPAHDDLDTRGFCLALSEALHKQGATLLLDDARVDAALGEGAADSAFGSEEGGVFGWLNDLEAQHRYLIYQAAPEKKRWSRRCLRQADRILLLVDALREPEMTRTIEWLKAEQVLAPIELVMIQQSEEPQPCRSATWSDLVGGQFNHHIHGAVRDNGIAALARRLTGHAIGVVFGGGGARGFAHLGLIRAMQELGLPIDLVGGSSMGALVAALYAMGQDYEDMSETLRELFVDHNNLNDYALSRVSLIKAQKFSRRLEDIFGQHQLEDLLLPCYVLSTNLSRSEPLVHDRGRVAWWVGASMSVPGIAPPMVWRGELLVDGSLINSVPTDVMAQWGRGPVVGADVSSDEEMCVQDAHAEPYQLQRLPGGEKRFNMFNILFQTATMTSHEVQQARISCAELYLRMPVREFGMFSWEDFDNILFRGYNHAVEQLAKALEEGTLKLP